MTIAKPPRFALSGPHTVHPGRYCAVGSRNGARADIAVLKKPTGHLAHHAHYVDHLPRYGAPTTSHVLHHIWAYLAAADAVGAWG